MYWGMGIGCVLVLAGIVAVVILVGQRVADYQGGMFGDYWNAHEDPENQELRQQATDMWYGLDQDMDWERASELYKQAYYNGDTLAGVYLFLMYMYEDPQTYDPSFLSEVGYLANDPLEEIAQEGNPEAKFLFAAVWINYPDDPRYYRVMDYAQSAADAGFYPAYSLLGAIHERGEGTEINLSEAANWYGKAQQLGCVAGVTGMGRLYINDDWEDYDPVRGLDLLEQAAEAGSTSALLNLGYVYEEGVGCEPDRELAFEYYMRAADEGVAEAVLIVARCYRDGVGVEPDTEEARRWLERALHWDYPAARTMLRELDEGEVDDQQQQEDP